RAQRHIEPHHLLRRGWEMVDPIELNDALERVSAFLDGGDLAGAVDYLRTLHPADSAEILAELEPEEQASIVDRLQATELAEVFEQLDKDEMHEVAQPLDDEMLADVLHEMQPDVAAAPPWEPRTSEVDERRAESE